IYQNRFCACGSNRRDFVHAQTGERLKPCILFAVPVGDEKICRLARRRQCALPVGIERNDVLDRTVLVGPDASFPERSIEYVAARDASKPNVGSPRLPRRGQAVDIALSIVAESDREQIARASGALWYLEDIVVALGLYPPPS